MTSDSDNSNTMALNRRHFLTAGAAGIAAAGIGINTAQAQPEPPGEKLRTNSKTGIRTAVITDTQLNIGPYLAQEMAKLNYNLVIADVRKGLEAELRKLGASKVVVRAQSTSLMHPIPSKVQPILSCDNANKIASVGRFTAFSSATLAASLHACFRAFEAALSTSALPKV